jgi:ABC-2 type transport system permease protein
MLGASLYIIGCSARNRLRVRLRRLREPRYLFGAIVGAAYIYFTFFARIRMARGGDERRRAGRTPPPALVLSAIRSTAAPALAGVGLLMVTALGWLMPFDSGLLDFSEAEIQFLFPAPVSRRALLVHRLLRSQLGLLFGSLIAGIFMPSMSGFARLRIGVAMWLLMCTAKVYFTGISLARARLGSHDAQARRVAWLPLGVLFAALAIVGGALTRAFLAQPATGLQDAMIRVGAVAATGLPRVVMWPFMALSRPLFAVWPGPYLLALLEAAAVLAVCVAWVLKSDATFQDAATAAAERKAGQPAARMVTYHARSSGWRLAPAGRPEMAFAWKGAMQTLRVVDRRTIARILSMLLALTIGASTLSRTRGVAAALGAFAMGAAAFLIVLGPQALRMDLRDDLRHLEVLKTWPVKSSAVVRGELIWPGALLTAMAWTAIAIALYLSGTVMLHVSLAWRIGVGIAIAILTPGLVFSQLTIHNAIALVFPAWVALGNQRARGLDAMGQRLIVFFGTFVLLILSVIPGAIAGAILWFALARFIGPMALVPAALVCTVIIGVEVLIASEALGPAYERLDMMAVERAE